MGKKLTVKCPKCKVEFNYYSSEYRPFCSKRCKMVDLGNWLEEGYTVPVVDYEDVDLEEIEDGQGEYDG